MCKYQCYQCSKQFDEPDFVEEKHGLDSPPYEKVAVCPYCHGWFEEMYQCKICGQYFTDDELSDGVCDECIYEHSINIELCHKFGQEAEESIKINGFIASVFSEEQINEILWNRIKEINRIVNVSCYAFIDGDKSWFAEQLIKEKNDAEEF